MTAPPGKNPTYGDRIDTLCDAGFPGLRYLRDFKKQYHDPRATKWTKLDFSEQNKEPNIVPACKFDPNGYANVMHAPRGQSRILIVLEGLSSGMIEYVGAAWDVDPYFFASYIRSADWEPADEYISSARLPSSQKSDGFVCLSYLEPIRLPQELADCSRAETVNDVKRSLEIRSIYNTGKKIDSCTVVGLLSRKVALWTRKYDNGCFEAVLLCDSILPTEFDLYVELPSLKGKERRHVSAWSPWAGGCVNILSWQEVANAHIGTSVFQKSQNFSLVDGLIHHW